MAFQVIGAAPGSHTDIDWHKTWLESQERQNVRDELQRFRTELPQKTTNEKSPDAYKEFAVPLIQQYKEVQIRVFQQLWRTPSYIWSKLILVSAVGLFIGFSLFKADNSIQGELDRRNGSWEKAKRCYTLQGFKTSSMLYSWYSRSLVN